MKKDIKELNKDELKKTSEEREIQNVVNELIGAVIFLDCERKKPGALIKRLSKNKRRAELIKKLKAHHFDVRKGNI